MYWLNLFVSTICHNKIQRRIFPIQIKTFSILRSHDIAQHNTRNVFMIESSTMCFLRREYGQGERTVFSCLANKTWVRRGSEKDLKKGHLSQGRHNFKVIKRGGGEMSFLADLRNNWDTSDLVRFDWLLGKVCLTPLDVFDIMLSAYTFNTHFKNNSCRLVRCVC